jgi:hypothetical protein
VPPISQNGHFVVAVIKCLSCSVVAFSSVIPSVVRAEDCEIKMRCFAASHYANVEVQWLHSYLVSEGPSLESTSRGEVNLAVFLFLVSPGEFLDRRNSSDIIQTVSHF